MTAHTGSPPAGNNNIVQYCWVTLFGLVVQHGGVHHLAAILQALHEMHKILSQVEILGSPIMLGSSLISGLSTFLAEPAKARNPTEFARGVGTGSVTLVKMASFGILTFIRPGQLVPRFLPPPLTSVPHTTFPGGLVGLDLGLMQYFNQ